MKQSWMDLPELVHAAISAGYWRGTRCCEDDGTRNSFSYRLTLHVIL